jgi:hypothetical protein
MSNQYYNNDQLITTDATDVETVLTGITSDADQSISILEKAYRIADLHDPDLIDIKYIQYFAKNLGYNVNVSRNEVGGIGASFGNFDTDNTSTSGTDADRYLRFMVSNLPSWYKIKTTDSAIEVMLYSFGLVGDLIKYYTENYLDADNGGKWQIDTDKTLASVPTSYYTTPHFALLIEVDESDDLITDVNKRSSIIRAIDSVRPINTVFRSLVGHCSRDFHVQVQMDTRLTRYIRIGDDILDFSWEQGGF